MVFGFFNRRPTQAQLPEYGDDSESTVIDPLKEERAIPAHQLRTPSPSVDSASLTLSARKPAVAAEPESLVPEFASHPPQTPSPPPPAPDPSTLFDLIANVPAQTFHSYALQHLKEPHLIDLTHETLSTLETFFTTLSPPPLLHCVRCHKNYCEVDNTDRSCLIAHDDESAEIERARRVTYSGSDYVTHYGCCDKTVEGEGDMGPPDGYCYEGRHTTDARRARFRADSTPQDDKLISCGEKKCFEPRPSKPRRRRSMKQSVKPESKALSESSGSKRKRADSNARSESPGKSVLTISPSRKKATVLISTPPPKQSPRRKPSLEIVEDSEAESMDIDAAKGKGKASKSVPRAAKPLSAVRSNSSLKPTSKLTRKPSTLGSAADFQRGNDTPSPRKKKKAD